ncbi:MAG: DUF1385 domain-containing protein [Fusobacteriota bacterium]
MNREDSPNIGGQAVIEGVMMKGTNSIATAVRRPDGEIVYRKRRILENQYKILKKPFIRGIVALLEAMIIGIKELTFSAVESGEEEEEELSDFELGMTVFISLGLGITLFFLLPSFVGNFIESEVGSNIAEGLIRILLFISYVWGISFSEDIRRVFQYHGAEHKSIYTYENNEKLEIENAQKYTTLHPRCGTSFLVIVMLISMIIFSVVDILFLNADTFLIKTAFRFLLRIAFLPLIASIAYEFQRYSSRHLENPIVKLLATPGLWLQKITTREPNEEQLEVGLVALRAALGEEDIENATELKGENI